MQWVADTVSVILIWFDLWIVIKDVCMHAVQMLLYSLVLEAEGCVPSLPCP